MGGGSPDARRRVRVSDRGVGGRSARPTNEVRTARSESNNARRSRRLRLHELHDPSGTFARPRRAPIPSRRHGALGPRDPAACAFASEDKAASGVEAALRAVDVGATRPASAPRRPRATCASSTRAAAADARPERALRLRSAVGAGTASERRSSLRSCPPRRSPCRRVRGRRAAIRDAVAAACARAPPRVATRRSRKTTPRAPRAISCRRVQLARPDATFIRTPVFAATTTRARRARPGAAREGGAPARRARGRDGRARRAAKARPRRPRRRRKESSASASRAPTTGDRDAEDRLGFGRRFRCQQRDDVRRRGAPDGGVRVGPSC